jgi:ELWxxDGT repeat protein/VCBS repeat-containing protein
MANSDTQLSATQQVVFIDPNVPDLQDLLNGLAPGVQAFVLDPSSDGIEQIADILAANGLTGLSSISIVGHGAAGEIDLGSTVLDDSDLSADAGALAQIGAALGPGGSLQLYACDTASGAAGQQFIADLSQLAGGVDVAAATQDIGQTATGENWTLDATTGAPVAPASAPFTAQALANFQGTLVAAVTGQLWYGGQGSDGGTSSGSSDNQVGHIDSDAAGRDVSDVDTQDADAGFQAIGLDTAAGLYFAMDGGAILRSGHITNDTETNEASQFGTTVSSQTGAELQLTDTANGDEDNAIAVDPVNHIIYTEIWGKDDDTTAIIKISYDPTTGVMSSPYNSSTGTLTAGSNVVATYNTTGGKLVDVTAMSFDIATGKLYYIDDDLGYNHNFGANQVWGPTKNIYVIDTTNANPSSTLTQLTTGLTATDANTYIAGFAVDEAKGIIYYSINNVSAHSTQIFWMPIAGGAGTAMTIPGGVTLGFETYFANGSNGMAIDQNSQTLYVGNSTGSVGNTNGNIVQLTLSGDGHSFTAGNSTFEVFDGNENNANTGALLFDDLPTLSNIVGTTTEAVQGGSAITLLSATPGIADKDNVDLGFAEVVIANAQTGDILAATTTGTNITASYDSTTHTLTLSGDASFASYETVLDTVTFQDTGTDNSTGSHPTRTIDWIISDGTTIVDQTTADSNEIASTVVIDRAPTVVADSYSVPESGTSSGTSGTGGTGVFHNDSDKDGDSLTVTAVNGSPGNLNSATFTGTYGHFDLQSNGSFTYNADLTSAINSAATGSHPVDSFTYTVSDGVGGVSTTTVSFTIDRPPTAVADSYTVVESNSVSGTSGTAGTGVLGNDSDKDGDTITVSQVDGSVGDVGVSTAGTYGHLTLNANGSFTYTADITSAINGATPGSSPVDSFTYTDSDGHGGTTTQSVSFTVERPPVVDLNGAGAGDDATASFTEQTSLDIVPSATITNLDASTLTSLTATLTARPDGNGVESLSLDSAATSLAATDGLTVAYTATTGVLSITGSASTADYQSILDGIVYDDGSDDPNTTNRTVNVVAATATETGASSSVIISVTAVNDPPVNHVPAAQTVNENAALIFNSADGNLISITDPDVESGNETVTLSVIDGTLTLGSTAGLASLGGNGTSSVTFSGTLTELNNALDGLAYQGNTGFSGSDTLTITTNDNGNTPAPAQQDQSTVSITVNAVAEDAYFLVPTGPNSAQLWHSDETGSNAAQIVPASGSFADPADLTQAGGNLFFVDQATGALWVTNGLSTGTTALTGAGVQADDLTAVGQTLYFVNDADGTLWSSDGTSAAQLSAVQAENLTAVGGMLFFVDASTNDLYTATPGSSAQLVGNFGTGTPTDLTADGAELYFVDSSGNLWKSDGTAANTAQVTPASGSFSSPSDLVSAGGLIYFIDSGTGDLWRSDGSAAGTIDLLQGDYGSQLTAAGNHLFFVDEFNQLWVSDGTVGGTQQLTSDAGGPVADQLTAVGDKLFFTDGSAATGGRTGALWVSDGTSGGTVEVTQANGAPFDATDLADVNGALYFQAYDPVHGTELWTSDGTAAGTHLVDDIVTGSGPETNQFKFTPFAATSDHVYFLSGVDPLAYSDIVYTTDGTPGGTAAVDNGAVFVLTPGSESPTPVGNTLYFTPFDAATGALDLWKTDGTVAGTAQVTPASGSFTVPGDLTAFNSTVYFLDGADNDLWKSDGTSAGTADLGHFNNIADLTVFGSSLYFTSNGDIWAIDASNNVTQITSGTPAVPTELTPVGGTLYFTDIGFDLWKTDGGPGDQAEVLPASGSFDTVQNLTNVGGALLFFTAQDLSTHQITLWESDGTSGGTTEISGAFSSPNFLTALGTKLYFVATDGSSTANTLWKTDGTTTTEVFSSSTDPLDDPPTVADGTLYFVDAGGALWMTTPGSTTATAVTSNEGSFSQVTSLRTEGNVVYFQAFDASDGYQLWTSDGTAAGTVRLTDATEPNSSDPFDIVAGPHHPTVTISPVADINGASSPPTITFTFSEAVQGFDASDVTTIGGSIGALTQSNVNPDVYTATFTPTAGFSGQGSIAVAVDSYTDLAGDAGEGASVTFAEDTNNQAPTVSDTTGTYTATEQTVLDLKNTGMSVGDVDSGGAAETMTLSVTEGTLNVTVGDSGVTIDSGNNSSSVEISGTIAELNALLGAGGTSDLSYIDDTDDPSASATLTLEIDDNGHTGGGGAQSGSSSSTIDITAVNDAPVVTAPASYTGTPNVAFAITGVTFSDVDAEGSAEQATFAVTDGTLTATSGGGVTVAGSGGQTVTLTGTIADLNTFIANSDLTFSGTQSDTLDITINDEGNTGSGGPLTDSTSVPVSVDDAPVLNNVPATAAYTEGAAAVQLSVPATPLTVTDADGSGNDITSATVAISSGLFSGDELVVLDPGFSATPQTSGTFTGTSITYSYDSGTGTLTLTGADTLANYSTVLDAVEFVSTSDNPTSYGTDTSRTVTWSVTDVGGASSAAGSTTTIDITALNNAPVAVTPSSDYSATEQTDLSLWNTGLSVSDVDGGVAPESETATLSVGEGILTVTAGTSGATVGNSGTSSVTISGTIDQINALLNTDGTSSVVYNDNTDSPSASTTLTLEIDDGGNTGGGDLTGTAQSTIDVTAVDDPPVAVTPGADYSATEGTTLDLKNTGLSVSDVDAGGGSETITLSVGEGTLTVTAGNSGVTGITGNNTSSVEFSGTIAELNALLGAGGTGDVSYVDNNGNPAASTSLTLEIDDNGHTGSGGPLTATSSTNIDVTAVNSPPVATVPGTAYSATEQTDLALQGTGLSVSDVDGLGGSETVTLSVGQGILTVDAGTSGVTGLSGSGTGTVSFSGTLAELNALLDGSSTGTIVYNDNTDTPSTTTTLTLTIDDNGNTGAGIAQTANAQVAIDVAAVDDSPVASTPPAHYSATEGTTLDLKNTGLSVSDVDAEGGSETVTLLVGEGTLTVSAGNSGVTGISGNGTSTVHFSGTIAALNALLGAGGTGDVTYVDNNDNPTASTSLTLEIDDNGHTGTGGPLVATATASIDITAVNDAPHVSAAATYSALPHVTTALTGITFSDVDAEGGVEVASFSVTGGTLAATSGGGVTAGGSGSHAVTLTGTLADLNAFIAGGDLTFTGSLNDTLDITINDQGNTGSGGPLTGHTSAPINVNGKPVLGANTANDAVGHTVKAGAGRGVLSNASDPGGGTLAVSAVSNSAHVVGTIGASLAGSFGHLTLNANGSYRYVADMTAAIAGAPTGTHPVDTFTYTVTDSFGQSATSTLAITIDRPPTATVMLSSAATGNSVDLKSEDLRVSDPDGANTAATATLSVGEGTLIVKAGDSGATVTGSGTSSVTISGTFAQVDALLQADSTSTVTYLDSTNDPAVVTALTLSVSDGTLSDTASANLILTADALPPAATKVDMFLRNADGAYEIYDIGNSAFLASYQIGEIARAWRLVALDGFNGTDTADMLLRNSASGDFEIKDVGNNTITGTAALGNVGLNWRPAGFGDFSGNAGETDMLMRDKTTGAFELYDIADNEITFSAPVGSVGPNWTVAGFGHFSGNAGETDMLMRDRSTGNFEVYDIAHNTISSSTPLGNVGLNWRVAGFGDFSGNAGETDMLMRDHSNGDFEVYDITDNKITSSTPLGNVGLNWQVVGFGDFSGNAGETDMLMRDRSNGDFEVYDITDNKITSSTPLGNVGLNWQVAGFGDFSGNAGETDMLMRNSATGTFELYDITGNKVTYSTALGNVGTQWTVGGFAVDPPAAQVTVGNGANLSIASASTDAVTFAGPSGTLTLGQSASFTGTIAGFAAQDQIDLSDIGFGANTTLGYDSRGNAGTLTVNDGVHSANLTLLGNYMASSFAAAGDGHGGTLIGEPANAAQNQVLAHPQG